MSSSVTEKFKDTVYDESVQIFNTPVSKGVKRIRKSGKQSEDMVRVELESESDRPEQMLQSNKADKSTGKLTDSLLLHQLMSNTVALPN